MRRSDGPHELARLASDAEATRARLAALREELAAARELLAAAPPANSPDRTPQKEAP